MGGPYGMRGHDSDGDDSSDARRSDYDVTSNADILTRRGRDYESGSSTSGRPFISTPQYHLMPTEEEETERRQSAKGQQLERMKYRRNVRLSRQSAGVSTADTVPGFRGEASLEELISYIDAPAALAAANDCKTVRKSKKKKKKVSAADSSDAGANRLANSCEVFVGSSDVSVDEPSVRVGDSCCIELRKKVDADAAIMPVNTTDSQSFTESSNQDSNVLAIGTVNDNGVNNVNNPNTPTDTDICYLEGKVSENLPEVGYIEVKNTVLEEERNVFDVFSGSIVTTSANSETLAVDVETAQVLSEVSNDVSETAGDADQISGIGTRISDRIDSLTEVVSCEDVGASLPSVVDQQNELYSILPLPTASDSVTSDTSSIEESFVTVQKKKRTKNAAAAAEDPRARFGRRPSTKGADDRDYYVKRSWVKSSDSVSVVPSVNVCHASIVYSKPSCPVTQRNVAQYTQASSYSSVSSSPDAGKFQHRSGSAALSFEAKSESVGIAEHDSHAGEPVVKDLAYTTLPSDRDETDRMCGSEENENSSVESDLVRPFDSTLPADASAALQLHAPGQKRLVDESCNKSDSYTSSDVLAGTGDAASCDKIVIERSSVDVTSDDRSAVNTDIESRNVTSNLDDTSRTGDDPVNNEHTGEEKAELSQLPVQNLNTSDVFLDTRNIAGTTPPRSDISFGFDPTSSPERSDISVSHCVSPFSAAPVSCHCPLVAPVPPPPPIPGCAPVLYFYPAMPLTILPPVATFPTGRCTPVGVVPPMPAVAEVSNIPVAAPLWQPAEDKVISVPVTQVEQDTTTVNEETLSTDALQPSTLTRTASEFVLSVAQRYLYSGKLLLCNNLFWFLICEKLLYITDFCLLFLFLLGDILKTQTYDI